jgi:hypothetical protein
VIWQPLSALLGPLWRAARRPDAPATMPTREAAAYMALEAFGPSTVTAQPALVNVAALAWSARARLVVHQLRPAVARLVDATDLHAEPPAPPALLQEAWLVEARSPERGERLFGDTACLGGYPLDGAVYLVGLRHPDGVAVVRWRPRWTGDELAEGIARDASPLIDDVDAHHAWARAAARFATVLGVLLDATGAPLRTRDVDDAPKGSRPARGTAPAPASWTTRHLYVASEPEARAGGGGGGAATTGDRTGVEVPVTGHLKRQRHGPGNGLTRWIYVAGYQARRWIGPRPVRIDVA